MGELSTIFVVTSKDFLTDYYHLSELSEQLHLRYGV